MSDLNLTVERLRWLAQVLRGDVMGNGMETDEEAAAILEALVDAPWVNLIGPMPGTIAAPEKGKV